ncbi:MAG: hypothetical protein AB1521_08560 [Bacteroidota bacterium]
MKHLFFSSILFLTLISQTGAQSSILLGVNVGIIKHFDNGFGGNFTAANYITDRLALSFSYGFFSWNDETDINELSRYGYITKKKNNALQPITVGIKYYFGRLNINPYFGLEWGLNILKKNYYFPISSHQVNEFTIYDYTKLVRSELFASFGLEFGIMLGLAQNFSVNFGMRNHWGGNTTYPTFSTGLVYGI